MIPTLYFKTDLVKVDDIKNSLFIYMYHESNKNTLISNKKYNSGNSIGIKFLIWM